jgi:hypothetical protein
LGIDEARFRLVLGQGVAKRLDLAAKRVLYMSGVNASGCLNQNLLRGRDMRRCLIFLLGGLPLMVGAAADAEQGRLARCIPLAGPLDASLVESYHQRLRRVTRESVVTTDDAGEKTTRKVRVLILDLRTKPGPLDLAISLAKDIHALYDRGIETVAFVQEAGSPSNTLLAMACEKLFLTPQASLAPVKADAFRDAGEDARDQLLATVDTLSSRRPTLRPLYRGLVDPGLEVHAVVTKEADGFVFYGKADYEELDLDEVSRNLLRAAVRELGIDPDVRQRIIAVARTIASLDGREPIEACHLSEAINYRMMR